MTNERRLGEFGWLVREVRHEKGISQAALARRAGISPGYVGLIETGERGTRPTLDITRRIIQALEASVEDAERLMRAAGHLGDDEPLIPAGKPTTVQAIEANRRLSRAQKRILIDILRSWLPDEP